MTITTPRRALVGAFVTCLLSSLLACGDDDGAAATTSPPPDEATEPHAGGPVELSSEPCELLTEDLVRSTFGLDASTELEQERTEIGPNTQCEYRWALSEQAKQARAEKLQEISPTVEGAQDLAIEAARGMVTLALSDLGLDSEEQARSRFRASVDMFESRFGRESDGEDASATSPVEGTADEAVWIHRTRTLFMRQGEEILNIEVRRFADEEEDLSHAKRLATAILG